MAVTITSGAGTSYTIGGATWDWNDVRGAKTWDTAYATSYDCTEADAAPAFAELPRKTIGVIDPEVFSVASAQKEVWTAISNAFSAFSTAETYVDFCVWIQANLESFQTQTIKSVVFDKRALAEAFATVERRAASVLVSDSETFSVVDARSDVVAFARSFSSACSFAESQTDVWQVIRSLTEVFATAEMRAALTAKVRPETLLTTEARSEVWAATRNQAEPLGVASAAPTDVFRSSASAFSVADARTDVVQFVRNFASAISWTEIYFDNISWINAVDETCAFSVVRPISMSAFESEVFSATDRLAKAIASARTWSLSIGESYTDLIAWIQANSESVAFAEQTPSAIAKRIVRSLAIRDMLLRNASGVFGDLSVRSASMTSSQFADLFATRHPEGYDDFKQYLPGDYRFQKALVNIALIPTDGAAQTLSLQSARTTVDVPDVTDRGSQTLTTAGATISYARTFYIPPEIRVQQTGGAGPAIAMVSNVTTTSFFVRLFDAASPTTPVSGSISWSALAY